MCKQRLKAMRGKKAQIREIQILKREEKTQLKKDASRQTNKDLCA